MECLSEMINIPVVFALDVSNTWTTSFRFRRRYKMVRWCRSGRLWRRRAMTEARKWWGKRLALAGTGRQRLILMSIYNGRSNSSKSWALFCLLQLQVGCYVNQEESYVNREWWSGSSIYGTHCILSVAMKITGALLLLRVMALVFYVLLHQTEVVFTDQCQWG